MLKRKLHVHLDGKGSAACERLAAILVNDAALRAQYDVSLSMAGGGLLNEGHSHVYNLDSKHLGGLNGMLELAGFFRKIRPDIVHIISPELSGMVPCAARLAGAQLVVHTIARGTQEKLHASTVGKLASAIAEDVLVAASDVTRRKLQQQSGLGNRGKIPVIYADISVPFRAASAAHLRARMGLPQGQLLFAADLSVDSSHALERLVKVFARLRSRIFFQAMPVLAVCGLPGHRMAAAARTAERHGLNEEIIFYGADESAREAAAACDVFVFPCAGHGDFQPSVLAAMAGGKTVVAVRDGMMPELLEGGKSGLLAKPGDEESLYRALELVINDTDLKVKMGYAAKNRFESNFKTGSTAKAYLKIYDGTQAGVLA